MKKELNPGEQCEARTSGYGEQCSRRATGERLERYDTGERQDGNVVWNDRMRSVCTTHQNTKWSINFLPTAEEKRYNRAVEVYESWEYRARLREREVRDARDHMARTGLARCPECPQNRLLWRTDLPQHRSDRHGVLTETEFWDELLASLDTPLEEGDRIGQNT